MIVKGVIFSVKVSVSSSRQRHLSSLIDFEENKTLVLPSCFKFWDQALSLEVKTPMITSNLLTDKMFLLSFQCARHREVPDMSVDKRSIAVRARDCRLSSL